ncbi:MAG: hypothetical protein LBU37_03125 [Tannerellaceae bacterium]|nr:hypothetical protein [Tannerellaceae bacterium]
METTAKRARLTPWEKLQSGKRLAKRRNEEAAQRLNSNFAYIQGNAGKLMLSGIGSYLPPVATTFISHLWGIAKPALLAWGASKMQSLLLSILFGQKKKN